MRMVVVALVALAIGVAGAAAYMQARFSGALAARDRQVQEAEARAVALQSDLADMEARAGFQETEAQALAKQVEALQQQMASLEDIEPPDGALAGLDGMFPADAGLADDMPEADTPERGPRNPARPEARSDERSPEEEEAREAEREERREQWRQMRQQMRDRMDTFFAEAMANSQDRPSQERLASMQEYVNYLMEMRPSFREADTDEERQALREEFGSATRTLQQLTQEQQHAMIRQMAAQNGITDPAKVEQFVQDFRSLEQSPFFHPERLFWGGGFGGGDAGGFGGGGRPGFGGGWGGRGNR